MIQALRLTFYLVCFGWLTLQSNFANETHGQNQPAALTASLPEAASETPPTQADPVAVAIFSEDSHIQPGTPFWIAINLKMDPHWHVYWKNPGHAGMAPEIIWHLPEGFSTGPILWPTPRRFELSSMVGFGYENNTMLLVQIIPPASLATGPLDIGADIRWLVCSDSACLPGESHADLKIAVKAEQPVKDSAQASRFIQARARLPQPGRMLTAKRKDNLVELSFTEKDFIKKADFYPEHADAIDFTVPPLFEKHPKKRYNHTLILKENTSLPNLKGVLVLQTSSGIQSYDVDMAIQDPRGANKDIVMNDLQRQAVNDPLFERESIEELGDISFNFTGGYALALALAFIGGMFLNLMPCVLPVISFKILSFIKMAGQSRKLIFHHGLAFSGGVLLSFWVLAALLLSLQAYGRSVGWGFQLQEPIFVAILAAVIFIFGLSLFGLFEIGTSLIAAAGQAQQNSGQRNALVGSFLSGILATAVATPCTGPFLGSAVGFAVTLPALQAMLIFTSLGLGMSLPYLLLAAFPSLMNFMPKPGAWMITFKEIMGFFMLATVLWLVWVFSAQTSGIAVSMLLAGFLLLSIGGWIYGKWAAPFKKRLTRYLGTLSALIFFIGGGYTIFVAASMPAQESYASVGNEANSEIADAWEEFSPKRVAELRAKGIPVFIDFTSKWCLICQANHMVLSTDEVTKDFAKRGVVKMKADWTKRDEVITAELKKFGRNSVPLYILYGDDEEASPQILPQVLTPDIVVTALEKIEVSE